MDSILHIFIILPLIGLILSFLYPDKAEKLISTSAFVTMGLQLLAAFGFVAYWLIYSRENLNVKDIVVFQNQEYEFLIDFYFDKVTAVYMLVGVLLTFMVTVYSRYYLHRERGYKRFFSTILFFYLGYNIITLSGNFETLFVGWEILGISSFLLIAFYRDRYLPVKNAVKVFSIYRIGDVGLILAMWASHHLWHENITFDKLNNLAALKEHLQLHPVEGLFISFMVLLAASAKSAQLPFSSWLPRAMEGPTPSSAIFYGSLSVHMGVFLLLRTYTFWEPQTTVRVVIALLGLATTFVTTGIARVQSSIKSQIAYSSLQQIGLIFVELALGFEDLALFHFAGNAFLRTYQLLVSPSVVSYQIREQFYHFTAVEDFIEKAYPAKMKHTLYILCLKEWNLDYLQFKYFWNPLKRIGKMFRFLDKTVSYTFLPLYVLGAYFVFHKEMLPEVVVKTLPIIIAIIGLITVLKSYAERRSPRLAWMLIIINHFYMALAIGFNADFNLSEIGLYLSGVVVLGALGYYVLTLLKQKEGEINLSQFQGHVYEHPNLAFLFLLSCLGVMGFPITPTFLGEDLIFTHIHEHQIALASIISLGFIVDGIALMRIMAKVFMGGHVKTYHEVAYKSS